MDAGDVTAIAFFSKAFPALFAIVDPIAAAPLFLGLVAAEKDTERRRVAFRAALTSTIVLAVFAAAGRAIFDFFGIQQTAFKIAGGIVLFGTSMEMIRGRHGQQSRATPEEELEARDKADVGIIPLGIPLLSGPGAIAQSMVWSAKAHSMTTRAALYAAIAAVGVTTLLSLLFARWLMRALGQTGINIATRVFGLILAATAAQFVVDGVRDVLHSPSNGTSMVAPQTTRADDDGRAAMRSPSSQSVPR